MAGSISEHQCARGKVLLCILLLLISGCFAGQYTASHRMAIAEPLASFEETRRGLDESEADTASQAKHAPDRGSPQHSLGERRDMSHLGTHLKRDVHHQHLRLFVGVLSASKKREAREAIRATWGADHRLHRCCTQLSKPFHAH